jgi:hypothetical protein
MTWLDASRHRKEPMPELRPILVVSASALALAAAGCGSSSSDSVSNDAPKQDAAVKSAARQLVVEVESCFVDQQSYTACKKPAGTTAPIGAGKGQVQVSAATDSNYTIIAKSKSGATFKVARDGTSGAMTRTCTPTGKGGCPAGGTW